VVPWLVVGPCPVVREPVEAGAWALTGCSPLIVQATITLPAKVLDEEVRLLAEVAPGCVVQAAATHAAAAQAAATRSTPPRRRATDHLRVRVPDVRSALPADAPFPSPQGSPRAQPSAEAKVPTIDRRDASEVGGRRGMTRRARGHGRL